MYFAYVDETGYDDVSPFLVMVAVIADGSRLPRTQREFAGLFTSLTEVTGRPLRELKSSDMLPGRGTWRDVQGEVRRNVVSNLCQWVVDRRHKLAVAALDRAAHAASEPGCPELADEWRAAACHIALQIQRAHQSKTAGKGRTVLVFDDNKRGMDGLVDLIYEPPEWIDHYYERGSGKLPLDQLVDTPFAVKSHHVGLVQVADVFAAVFRRFAELAAGGLSENYPGELGHYAEWIELLRPTLLGREHRWPRAGRSPCADWYRSLAPAALLRTLG